MNEKILGIENLNLDLNLGEVRIPILHNISFTVQKGEFVSLVGESGCGKSMCALAITRLLPSNLVTYKSGKIDFLGKDLLSISKEEIQKIRGNDIAYIFQEPFSSLNPLHKISDQLIEGFLIHGKGTRKEAIEKASYLLYRVGITDIPERLKSYPNQMSGGMLQRICIAMALMCDPILLIADEPTSAIDVTIQSQLIELLFELKREMNLSILFISHDIALVSSISDRIQVMYAGCIVESGSTDQVIDSALHPYTSALLLAYPSIQSQKQRLIPIPGMVPSPYDYPKGCHFQDRCKYTMDICREKKPELLSSDKEPSNHFVACFNQEKMKC